jgi:hypothetical protein
MERIHDSIFVVVDTLTKSAQFIPVRMTYHLPNIVTQTSQPSIGPRVMVHYRIVLIPTLESD